MIIRQAQTAAQVITWCWLYYRRSAGNSSHSCLSPAEDYRFQCQGLHMLAVS
jgi:hypothetical protein